MKQQRHDRPDAAGRLTVYHDGSCPLCAMEIAHYADQDDAGRLAFVDVSEPGAEPGADLTRHAAMRRFHVRRSDGTLLSGAAAFAEIWRTLPRWRIAGRVAALPGVTAALEGVYRLFLPVRPYLSRLAGRLARRRR
ncbi:DCC1-like thiol-disulfide oxidoreductase family protein [Roseovarius salis]|uniref:thiol-disulfide oxidoreductase DCC family protein n=1 Tax=Roseovarius salis TaxID=3376063 RepID=UPI0037C82B0D